MRHSRSQSHCPVWLMSNSSTSPTATPNGITQEFLSVSPATVIEIWGLSPEISQKVLTVPPPQSSILVNPRRSQKMTQSDALIGPMLFDSMMPGCSQPSPEECIALASIFMSHPNSYSTHQSDGRRPRMELSVSVRDQNT